MGDQQVAASPAAAAHAPAAPPAIANPVINSPFTEPARHFLVADGRVSGAIGEGRRPSEFFVPVAKPKKASPQLTLQFGGDTRQQQNEVVNEVRAAVGRWRVQGYPHTTAVTRELLAHWRADDRERRLFFCQLEAAETAIYLVEAAEKLGDTKALNTIRAENARLNDALPRLAAKMATGSGKTVVMGMLIAWQALNKLANPYDKRFGRHFLIVTPGITIRDRLRVLLPNDPQTFYRAMDLVTPEQLDRLQAATIEITNYHAFIRREKVEAAGLTKRILAAGDPDGDRFKETPAEMVRRVCRVFGTARDVVVLNDEAHHCYTPAPPEEALEGAIAADERTEARENQEEARVWFEGLRALRDKLGARGCFPSCATSRGAGSTSASCRTWATGRTRSCSCSPSGATPRPSASTARWRWGRRARPASSPPCGRTTRSARPTASRSIPPRPASTRPRATSTGSPRTRPGRPSSPPSSRRCRRSRATPRTRGST